MERGSKGVGLRRVERACKLAVGSREDAAKTGPIGCAPTLIGAPVSALLSFLSKTPPDAVAPPPWLGIAGEPDTSGAVHGVRVMAVAPQSPAQKAGLKAASGDVGRASVSTVIESVLLYGRKEYSVHES